MDVLDAIKSRKSIRAFTDQPVSRETIEQILDVSQRAPSGTNTQPWHVYICAGEVRQAIIDDVLALAAEGKAATYEDYDYYPPVWNDVHRDRRRGVGWGLYRRAGQVSTRDAGMAGNAYRASDSAPAIRECHAHKPGSTGAVAHGACPLAGYIECLVINTPAAAAATGAQQGRSQRDD